MRKAGIVTIAILSAGFGYPVDAMNVSSEGDSIKADALTQSETTGSAGKTEQLFPKSETSPPGWGVQLAGSFSKERALASFDRARQRHSDAIGDLRPIIIDTPYGNRGPAPFYRVRLPAYSHTEAVGLCDRIRSAGGSCVVLPIP